MISNYTLDVLSVINTDFTMNICCLAFFPYKTFSKQEYLNKLDGLFITAQALKDKRQPSTAGSRSYDGVHRLNSCVMAPISSNFIALGNINTEIVDFTMDDI